MATIGFTVPSVTVPEGDDASVCVSLSVQGESVNEFVNIDVSTEDLTAMGMLMLISLSGYLNIQFSQVRVYCAHVNFHCVSVIYLSCIILYRWDSLHTSF